MNAQRRILNGSSGVALLEVMLGAVMLSVIISGVFMSVAHMSRSAQAGGTQSYLLSAGQTALDRVRDDLQRSGFTTVGALDYPHLFEDGVPGADFAPHAHAAPTPAIWAGGPNREIVFRIPADADGDGRPDLDANNQASWGAEEISYVVVPSPTGGNRLERRVDGAFDRVTARYVDRVTFDDAVTSGFAIPLNALRVRIDFAKRDPKGVMHRHTVQTVFRLRNGGVVN